VTRASQVFVYYPQGRLSAEYCLEADARLQNQALVLLLLLRQEGSSGGRFEDFADTLVGFGRAFEVFVGTNLLAHFLTLFHCHWFLRCLCQFFNGFRVVSEVVLAAYKDDGETLAEMEDFRDPLLLDVVE